MRRKGAITNCTQHNKLKSRETQVPIREGGRKGTTATKEKGTQERGASIGHLLMGGGV